MDYSVNYWAFFYAIACAQGIFLGLLLLAKPAGVKKANRYLAVLTFLLTLYLFDIFLGFLGFFQNNPHLLFITAPLWYLFPVIMLFYVKEFIGEKIVVSWKSLVHLLPFVYVMFWFIPFYFLPVELKLEYMNKTRVLPGGNVLTYIYYIANPLQLLVYVFLLLKKLRIAQVSNPKQVHYKWLFFFITIIGIFGVIQFVAINIFIFSGYVLTQFKFYPLALFSLIIYTIGYLALIKPKILFPENIVRLIIKPNSVLTNEQLIFYADKVIQEIENKRLYLNPDFKYTSLASRVGISARYMSEVINRQFGKSFTDLINDYRVKEVQQRLTDKSNQQFTLLAIAFDSGFNSKASFNRIFKKHTGMTPSEYVNNNNLDLLH